MKYWVLKEIKSEKIKKFVEISTISDLNIFTYCLKLALAKAIINKKETNQYGLQLDNVLARDEYKHYGKYARPLLLKKISDNIAEKYFKDARIWISDDLEVISTTSFLADYDVIKSINYLGCNILQFPTKI